MIASTTTTITTKHSHTHIQVVKSFLNDDDRETERISLHSNVGMFIESIKPVNLMNTPKV